MNNTSNVTDRRIRCGHCGGYHQSVADVKACSMKPVVAVASTPAPITERQGTYLVNLMSQRVWPEGWPAMEPGDITHLTKSEAGKMIELLLAQPKKPQDSGIPDSIPDGRYAYLRDGVAVFYRVKTKDSGQRIVQKVLGSPGDFRYVHVQPSEAAKFIEAIKDDPGFASQLFGISVGACGVCGSPLTDPDSIALGIGPICARKYDW